MEGWDMSDRNQEDEKNFLSRWSQRKQEAKQPRREAPHAEQPSEPVAESAEPEFDLSSLPKLEDLTETTDMSAFLRKGVPESLRNAALRKSWALDPAIRNYVNPALEYAYDWNTPGGVPGNGEIGPGVDIARMVSQIMGGGESVAAPADLHAEVANAPAPDPACSADDSAPQKAQPDLPAQGVRLSSQAQELPDPEDAAAKMVQDSDGSRPAAPQHALRRHGSAKPVA
jgi:hypothetical protein